MSGTRDERRARAERLLLRLGAYGTLDAHVHLGFMTNAREVADQAASLGLALFANAVTPGDYLRVREATQGCANVVAGVGLHPWWVADGRAGREDVELACDLACDIAWVGEIGLDFSPRRAEHDLQLEAFRSVCAVCGEVGGKVMSIHAVRSADVVLDVLDQTGCAETCLPILHWFSGSTEALWRAVRLGVHFSVNEMQASTRRAREQLRLIPDDLLLFETDLPPGEGVEFQAAEIMASLGRAQALTASIRGADASAG